MSARPANIIRHRHTRAFTVIANDVLNDDRLALDEKGLLCWFLSLPEDWEIVPAHVQKKHHIGRNKFYSILKALRDAGYAEMITERASDGTIVCVRHVISDEPAIPASGDGSGIPDQRVREIEEADPDEPEEEIDEAHPLPGIGEVVPTTSPKSRYGEEGHRESNKDLENIPPTPQTLPIPPPPSFKDLCAKWPGDRIDTAFAAEKRFLRLSEDRRRLAFEGVEAYLSATRAKGWKICDLQTYLRDRRWERAQGAPATTIPIYGNTPQSFRWLEYRRAMGQRNDFLEELWRHKKPWYAPTEWPPPLPAKPDSAKAS